MPMARYQIYICGPSDCPNDPEYIHENLFGKVCVPRNFSFNTGRARGHHNQKFEHPSFQLGYKYLWDGGCDAKLRAELESPAEAPG